MLHLAQWYPCLADSFRMGVQGWFFLASGPPLFLLLILFAAHSSRGSSTVFTRAAFKHCPLLEKRKKKKKNTAQNSHHVEPGVLHDCELRDHFPNVHHMPAWLVWPPEKNAAIPPPPPLNPSQLPQRLPLLWGLRLTGSPLVKAKRCTRGSGLCILAGDYIPPVRDFLCVHGALAEKEKGGRQRVGGLTHGGGGGATVDIQAS